MINQQHTVFDWQQGMPSVLEPAGLAVAHYKMGFLGDQRSQLFPRQWLREQLAEHILVEQGIGHLNGEPVFVFEVDTPLELPNLQWHSMRHFMLEGRMPLFRLLAFASQIGTWAREHRFCGACGQPMQQAVGHRMMQCTPCRLQNYPRLAPCMIVVVTRGDEILLGRSPRFVSGMYSALAGYAEPNETIEQCVEREVREEVSLEVKNIRYIGSQNWPFPHSLMLGFHAEYKSGDIVPEPEEIEDARWFSVHDLPPLPAQHSIARYLIDLYVAQRLGQTEPVLPS
ncbi:NAD(+) diphosphatase [Pseudomonas sp. C27(2019)]|uniref:NAD(+) diphosphatase n=1 Tax=Pseudomonas sp. C27(2019) TaxID=2604941 RepID=UPI00211549B0|nr:NAD(+) diphosphatase [Pseudomonas sp. C27(2019)]